VIKTRLRLRQHLERHVLLMAHFDQEL